MYRSLSAILTLSSLLFLTGCGGGGSGGTIKNETDIPSTLIEALTSKEKFFSTNYPSQCTQNEINRFVYEVMHDSYLFAKETPTLDYTTYSNITQLFNDLKSSDDRYSFTTEAQAITNIFEEGKNKNFGLHLFAKVADNNNYYELIVSYVYPNSPADLAGIKRGDVVSKINNLLISDIQEASTMLSNEDSLVFEIDNQSYDITKAEYAIETVLYSDTIQYQNKKVGYIVFQSFIEQAIDELDRYFATFKREKVDELVLDLRYNGGGVTNVANYLATLIGGDNLYGKTFEEVYFNEKYSAYNSKKSFSSYNANALNLNRVFIITTGMTASSSELVINGLKASQNNVEVIQIGSTTYGKPYGFYPALFCDTALLAVNVESKNSDALGGYVNGIKPTCSASDDIYSSFGDTTESSLQEALQYISSGSCSSSKTTNKTEALPTYIKLSQEGIQTLIPGY